MNELTQYRDPPLAIEEFSQLDAMAKKAISFRERGVIQLSWEIDEYGDKVQKRQVVPCGPELFAKGEIDERLLKAMKTPAPAKNIIVHLTRLRAHKPYATGEDAWKIIIFDLCKDLHGVSEYAVMKTCEHFRQDTTIRFFPDTSILQRRIKDLDFSIRNLNNPPKAEDDPKPEPWIPDGQDRRRKVAEILHNAGIAHSKDFCGMCEKP